MQDANGLQKRSTLYYDKINQLQFVGYARPMNHIPHFASLPMT